MPGVPRDYCAQHNVCPRVHVASTALMEPFTLAAIIGPTFDKVAGAVLACGVFAAAWRIASSLAVLITTVNEKIVPNVQYMDDLPKLNPILTVVQEIAAQFRRDSGSSLKDDLDALAAHARENKAAALEAQLAAGEAQQAVLDARAAAVEFAHANAAGIAELQVLVGTIKERAKDDREMARSDRDLARDALEKIREIMASAKRTEESGARTEASGERIEADRASVADDLAESKKRADDVHEDEAPGTAADAASQSPE